MPATAAPPTFDGAPNAINAWARLYPQVALRHAAAADRRLARGRAPLLCGIPLGLKDLYSVRGLPLTASSRVLAGNVAPESSAVWARLRDAGMVLRRPHPHPRVRRRGDDRPGRQSLAPEPLGGRIERRLGGRARRAHGPGGDRHGHRRLAALPGRALRRQRDQAHARPGADVRGDPGRARASTTPGRWRRTVADCAALLQAMGAGALAAAARHSAARGGRRPLARAHGAR